MLKQPSPLNTVFCPHCHTVLMDSIICPNSDWKRPESGEEAGTLVWERALGGPIGKPYVTLVSREQLLIAAIEQGEHRGEHYSEIVALEVPTGEIRWRHALPPDRFARFLTLAGNLIISSNEHLGILAGAQSHVQALDALTGELAWQTELPAHSYSAPAVLDELLLVSASDHHIYALNQGDGAIVWRSTELPNWTPSPPTAGDGTVYIGGFTHIITALDKEGQSRPLFTNESEIDWFDIPFAYGQGILFAPCSGHQVQAIDSSDGQLRWSKLADRGSSAPPVVGEKQVFVPLKGFVRGLYLLRALDMDDGETRWEFPAHKHILAPPLFHEGRLYFGSRGGMFYALNAQTGELCWDIEIGEAVRSTVAIDGNLLFFGSEAGTIYCLRWNEEVLVPMLPAEVYREEGEWLLAGTVAALDGEWRAAAEDFDRAEHASVAAQFFERAEEWALAAPLYAQSNHFQRALKAYEMAGDRRHMAEMYLQLRQPEVAADLLVELGEYDLAAAIYHETGHLRRAARYYGLAGETEEAIKLYLALKQPESAAQLAEEAGDIDQAVTIWNDINNFEKAAELLVTADRRAEAADLLVKNSLIETAAQLWVEISEYEKAGNIFNEACMWVDAAQYYERAGLTIKAAETYFLAGEARKAADLYLTAGKRQKALTIYAQLKSYRAIAKIYEQQEEWLSAAQAYLAASPPRYKKAAACFIKIEAWGQAAQAYQDGGLIAEAVENWRKSETPRRGAELLYQQGNLAEAAALSAEIGNLQEAAEIEMELGNIKEAIILYRKLGNDERASQIARDYERWDVIGELAHESGDFEQEAEAALALAAQNPAEDYLYYRAAAQAFVRAAQYHESLEERLVTAEAIAKFWEQAAHYFDLGMTDDKQLIIQSERQARRLRNLPEIVLEVEAERILAIDRWDGLIVRVKNIGFGIARHVSVKVIQGEFEGKLDTQIFSGLLPDRTDQIRLNVRPRSAGSSVPLYIRLSYMTQNLDIVERDIGTEVPVHDQDSITSTSEGESGGRKPINLHRDDAYDDDRRQQTIIVQGDYITVGNISDATVAIGEGSSSAATDIVTNQAAPPPPPQQAKPTISTLAEKIDANFTLDEINQLAQAMQVDYAKLPGTVKLEKAYALVQHLIHTANLESLLVQLETQRPGEQYNWRAGFEE